MSGPAKRQYAFGPYLVDAESRELLRDGRSLPLAPKVFDLLLHFVENSGRVVTKDELLEALWPDSFVEEANLQRYVSTLRKALDQTPGEPPVLETRSKYGYRFLPSVRVAGDSDVESARVEPVGGAVPLDSDFYIERPVDAELRAALARKDSVVLIKGARHTGKTSLLARGLEVARGAGDRVVLTDLQALGAASLETWTRPCRRSPR